MMIRTRYGKGLLTAAALLAGCGGGGSAGEAGSGNPATPADATTYWEHAKPVLDAKCNSCHTQGGIAPFALETYAQVYPMREAIKVATQQGTMPPWPAAKGCADYLADRSLSPEQLDTLTRWVDDGGLEGDKAKAAEPLPGNGGGLSRVDAKLEMPVDYEATKQDDYRCFVLDWPETEKKFVTGFRANPGDARVVHHVIAYLVPPDQVGEAEKLDADENGPGYTCYGGSKVGKSQWLGAWAPGSLGSDTADGTGIEVEPGSKVVLQVHYNTSTAGPQPDRTSIDFRLDDKVEKEAKIQVWADPSWLKGSGMLIPAGDDDVLHSFAADMTMLQAKKPITIYSAGLHMHQLGVSGALKIERADGTSECVLDIPKWNFHWQGSYELAKPAVVNPGDKVYIDCRWDNSAANQPLLDGVKMPPHDVTWGEGTSDEMCLGTFYITR